MQRGVVVWAMLTLPLPAPARLPKAAIYAGSNGVVRVAPAQNASLRVVCQCELCFTMKRIMKRALRTGAGVGG